MDLQDVTKNQHFVSHVEQRLNAIDIDAGKKNQRIYSFSLKNRESHTISIDPEKGSKIEKNLSLNYLFNFDVLKEEAARYNFEKLFYDYETRIKVNTESLLSKICMSESDDIKSEILNIFRFKILNFVRNPYSIKKFLNTFSDLKNIFPTGPIHYKNFNRVLNGSKPQQNYLCKQLGITKSEYREWLAIIFLLLTPLKADQPNFLDQSIKRVYENPDLFIQVYVYTYDNETCLLSDRGFSVYEIEDNTTVWDFNLCSHGFIRYVFVNIDKSVPQNTSKEVLDIFKSTSNEVKCMTEHNDLFALEIYNQRVVELCYENVFNSSTNCYGITVV